MFFEWVLVSLVNLSQFCSCVWWESKSVWLVGILLFQQHSLKRLFLLHHISLHSVKSQCNQEFCSPPEFVLYVLHFPACDLFQNYWWICWCYVDIGLSDSMWMKLPFWTLSLGRPSALMSLDQSTYSPLHKKVTFSEPREMAQSIGFPSIHIKGDFGSLCLRSLCWSARHLELTGQPAQPTYEL